MTTPLRWASAHPVQTILFTFAFTLLAALMAVSDDLLPYGLIAFGVLQVLFGISMWRHARKLIPILLILACLGNQARAEEPKKAVGIGVGVVVVCVGGYCVYKLVKFCQKVFPPKSTNSNEGFMAVGSDEYAGAYEYSSIGSCWVPPDLRAVNIIEDLTRNPTTFTLNIVVEPAGVVTSMTANNKEGTTQTWDQFTADMAGHGLFLTGRGSYQPQFAINGVPCDSSLVPLEFDPFTGRVTQRTGGDLRRVVVERSPNLVDWSRLLQTDVGVGTGFQVVDTTTDGQMFYRITKS
jgi:hypothetical protein